MVSARVSVNENQPNLDTQAERLCAYCAAKGWKVYKDRLTRFGFKYIETLPAVQGRSIEVVNLAENPLEDLIADLVSISTVFLADFMGDREQNGKRSIS